MTIYGCLGSNPCDANRRSGRMPRNVSGSQVPHFYSAVVKPTSIESAGSEPESFVLRYLQNLGATRACIGVSGSHADLLSSAVLILSHLSGITRKEEFLHWINSSVP